MNWHEASVLFITAALYGTLLTGLLLLAKGPLIMLISRFKNNKRLRARKGSGFRDSRLEGHLRLLLESVTGKSIDPRVFEVVMVFLFLGITGIGFRNIPLGEALLSAVIFTSLPYIVLRIRLESIRRRSSFEGEALMSSILSQYRIKQFNIYETIEGVLLEANNLKQTRKLLFRLLIAIRSTGSDERINEAVRNFSFAINTNWSRMLGNCIKTAAINGINLSLALEDIFVQLREARTQAEERKRMNSEAVRMTIIMVPIMYIATVIMSINYMEIPVGKFIRNQFYTPEGFGIFLLTLFLFLLNLMLIEMIQNRKFDF